MVTNPITRDWTVTASVFATLNEMFGNRTVIGIGRGDSARRTIGYDPVTVGEFARSTALMLRTRLGFSVGGFIVGCVSFLTRRGRIAYNSGPWRTSSAG